MHIQLCHLTFFCSQYLWFVVKQQPSTLVPVDTMRNWWLCTKNMSVLWWLIAGPATLLGMLHSPSAAVPWHELDTAEIRLCFPLLTRFCPFFFPKGSLLEQVPSIWYFLSGTSQQKHWSPIKYLATFWMF